MAATVVVEEGNGSSPVWTPVSDIRFCSRDSFNPGVDSPIPIPATGFNYSYWKSLRLAWSGTFTELSNIKVFSDGDIPWQLGTDGGLRAGKKDTGDNGCPETEYEQSGGAQGISGYSIADGVNGHDFYKGESTPTANLSDYIEESPYIIDTGPYGPEDDAFSKHLVVQVRVAPDAIAGQKPSELIRWMWDEI